MGVFPISRPTLTSMVLMVLLWHGGVAAGAQTPMANPAPPGAPAVLPRTTPLATADFAHSSIPFAWLTPPRLRTCQAVFENAIAVVNGRRDDGKVNGTDTLSHAPVPASAIDVGERCLRTARASGDWKPYEWSVVLRLAIGTNDDTLVRAIVTRQLAAAGSAALDRAAVLERVILLLRSNPWLQRPVPYRTPAHDSLALQYLTVLDTLHPAGSLVTTRLRLFEEFHQDSREDGQTDTAPPIPAQREHLRQVSRIAHSVPLAEVPPASQDTVRRAAGDTNMLWLDYLETPTHANLMKWVTWRHLLAPNDTAPNFRWLVGKKFPPLQGDYWFNTPRNAPLALPTPGTVSLVVFVDVNEGNKTLDQTKEELERANPQFAKLRRLHVVYPTLQIVIVTMTTGRFQSEDLRARPEEEAKRLQQYLSDSLHLPGVVCVLRTMYHTEAGVTAVPMASPALDAYFLDPRDYDYRELLIDQEGWIVSTGFGSGSPLGGGLIQRLLAR